MWSAECGGSAHSKNRLISSRQHRATEVRKLRFLSSCQYTHGCYAPASWAARHTTVCLDSTNFAQEFNLCCSTSTTYSKQLSTFVPEDITCSTQLSTSTLSGLHTETNCIQLIPLYRHQHFYAIIKRSKGVSADYYSTILCFSLPN